MFTRAENPSGCAAGHRRGWVIAYNTFESDIGYAIGSDGPGHEMLFLRNFFSVEQPEPPTIQGQIGSFRLRENIFIGFAGNQIPFMGLGPTNRAPLRLIAGEKIAESYTVTVFDL